MTDTFPPGRAVCVLLPGMLCTGRLWAGQRSALAAAGRPAIDVPLRAPAIDAMAAEALAVPYPRLVLIGHSLGGIVAMAAARHAPDRVAAMVLLSTTARPPRPEQRDFWTALAARVTAGGFAGITPGTLLPTLVSPGRLSDAALCRQITSMADQTGPGTFLNQLTAQHSRIDERPALRHLTCPVLVIAGGRDSLCPVSRHEEIAALLPAARLEILPGSGHMSPLECPEQVSVLLEDWLPAALRTSKPSGPPRSTARKD